MAWETRRRGGKYYVRKHRIGSRVISEYIGRGESAELIAKLDQLERAAANRDHANKLLLDNFVANCLATRNQQPESAWAYTFFARPLIKGERPQVPQDWGI